MYLFHGVLLSQGGVQPKYSCPSSHVGGVHLSLFQIVQYKLEDLSCPMFKLTLLSSVEAHLLFKAQIVKLSQFQGPHVAKVRTVQHLSWRIPVISIS